MPKAIQSRMSGVMSGRNDSKSLLISAQRIAFPLKDIIAAGIASADGGGSAARDAPTVLVDKQMRDSAARIEQPGVGASHIQPARPDNAQGTSGGTVTPMQVYEMLAGYGLKPNDAQVDSIHAILMNGPSDSDAAGLRPALVGYAHTPWLCASCPCSHAG